MGLVFSLVVLLIRMVMAIALPTDMGVFAFVVITAIYTIPHQADDAAGTIS